MGVPEYSMTAAVWLRGMFEHEYGVPPSAIHWVQAGEEHPGRKDRVDFEMPAGVTMESRPDTTLNVMIENGEIDAMMSPRMPTCFLQGSPKVKRLFPNYRQVEMDYFKTTGLFPIMHVLVIKRSIYEKEPWVAQTLYKAFCAVERDLHARSLRHQYPARRSALDFRRVRRHHGADDDGLLALWPGAQPQESRNIERLSVRAGLDQAEACTWMSCSPARRWKRSRFSEARFVGLNCRSQSSEINWRCNMSEVLATAESDSGTAPRGSANIRHLMPDGA